MRKLMTIASIGAATLIPWNSLAPSWLSNPTGISGNARAESQDRSPGAPLVRLNPAWGIMPVPAEGPSLTDGEAATPIDESNPSNPISVLTNLFSESSDTNQQLSERRGLPDGIQCENGVCRLPDGTAIAAPFETPSRAATGTNVEDETRARLEQMGATQFRDVHDVASDEVRCSCSVPFSANSRAMRRFDAAAASRAEALRALLAQIEAWRLDRRE